MENMIHMMKIGDMIFSKWTFSRGMWYTMGLNDKSDPTTKCLFPNIVMSDKPKPLRRWGTARLEFLQSEKPFVAAQFGTVELFKHCAEIGEQAEMRKRNMMATVRKNPANHVTETDKSTDPIAWAGRMGNFQAQIHETIYADLIYA
jgi:hypothetical protein